MCIGYVTWVTIPRMRTTLTYISGILPVVALTIVSILNIIRLVARLIGDMLFTVYEQLVPNQTDLIIRISHVICLKDYRILDHF